MSAETVTYNGHPVAVSVPVNGYVDGRAVGQALAQAVNQRTPASLPGSIQVGPVTYRVRMDDAYSDAASSWGRIDYARQEIVLDSRANPDHLAVTLWHEVRHAICHQVGVPEADAEKNITQTSPTDLDVLRRNPALLAFLLGGGS